MVITIIFIHGSAKEAGNCSPAEQPHVKQEGKIVFFQAISSLLGLSLPELSAKTLILSAIGWKKEPDVWCFCTYTQYNSSALPIGDAQQISGREIRGGDEHERL